MKKISSAYWVKFIKKDSDGNEKGNGIEFENLVNCLLVSMYGKKWKGTGGSHDNNRDFWLYSENQHLWAECKNYSNTIAMNILAPTLVMAQIYEVNEILFFSRSVINRFAKNKILAFGEKTNKMVRFFDGVTLEALICTYASELPKKYSPVKYMSDCEIAKLDGSFVNIYFFQNAVSSVHHALEDFKNYTSAEKIYYNETFSLTFCLLNPFQEDQVDVYIEFMDEENERFSFQYFYPTIQPEDKGWYHACLKKGEGRAVSLNMRQSVYKPEIMLPRFHISFAGAQSENRFEWYSEKVIVKSHWVGSTRLIGNNYLKILDDTKHLLVNNPYISSLILTGSSGTGKTRVLTECQNIFLANGYRIISLSGQAGQAEQEKLEDDLSRYLIKELIAFLYEIPSDEILSLLEEKICLPQPDCEILECSEVEKAIRLLQLIVNQTEESLQTVLNKYAAILYEKLSKDKNVLIIDNMQFSGKAFQSFIEGYVSYAVNQQAPNLSILVCVFNTDYMTPKTSELLYNLLHADMKRCLTATLLGFQEKKQGIFFLQELTRTNLDENEEYFSEIINKISLKPYNLLQVTKYLEELNIVSISPDKKGYIIPNLEKYEALSNISNGITGVIEKRFAFIYKDIPERRMKYILSIIYIFDHLDNKLQDIFQINQKELDYLCEKNILREQTLTIYIFDHDIIRNFFYQNNSKDILTCLKYVQNKGIEKKIRRYPIPYLLYRIVIEKDTDTIIDTGAKVANLILPERIASLFYNCLLDAFIELLENQNYEGVYIKYIHQICTFIRQYDGSLKAWFRSKEAYDTIQAYYPCALSEDLKIYRPFIHFCCDIAVQKHMYKQEVEFIEEVLKMCNNAHPVGVENQDELNVLRAIMYNRWYISYNTESYKQEIVSVREKLMQESRDYGEKISDPQKRGLIDYLNNSDEGYNYYGYYKDKDKLFSIWDHCTIYIPTLVPEKTLNYYRKTVQYGLIEQDYEKVTAEIDKAMKYLAEGKYSHEPIIFKTFFSMAEVMAKLQHEPETNYFYNARIIDDILQMQQLLDNHKLGDILLLKGVNAYYAKKSDDVYYSFKEAYKHYSAGETSRYWIKKDLLEENVQYAFTELGIYKAGYDMSFLPAECRQPLTIFENDQFIASGIQRTGDLHLNLPLI